MNNKEKILLVQLLLEDLRGNWAGFTEERALKAKELCEELAIELNDSNYTKLAESCKDYIETSKRRGDWDGRYFRSDFPRGYINMDELHGLKFTFHDKSVEFKTVAQEYITYPKYRFTDWRKEE